MSGFFEYMFSAGGGIVGGVAGGMAGAVVGGATDAVPGAIVGGVGGAAVGGVGALPGAIAGAIATGAPGATAGALVGAAGGGVYGFNKGSEAGASLDQAISDWWNADEMAEEQPSSGPIADTCPTGDCPIPPEDDDDEQKGKDAKRMSKKELDRAAKNNDFKDAHDLKHEYGLDSKYDIFVDRKGDMYFGPRQGTGTPQSMGININGV